MLGMLIAGVAALGFWGVYTAGVAEAERELRRNGQWVEPPTPLPRARTLRRMWSRRAEDEAGRRPRW